MRGDRTPVLIVEDDASIRNLIGVALRLRGIESHQAKEGGEAIRLMQKVRYPLVILDLMMPGTSGYAVVEAIAEAVVLRPVFVFIVSANASIDRRRLPGDIVQAIIAKPFDVGALSRLIEVVLHDLEEIQGEDPGLSLHRSASAHGS